MPLGIWRTHEEAHQARVDELTRGHRTRRRQHVRHPVEDFLFHYYSHSPARLRRWHPGAGVLLEGAAGMPRAGWRFNVTEGDGVRLDLAAFLDARGATVAFVRELLTRTAGRPPHLGCFGLHEWAMVHRLDEDEVRHRGWPLRLGSRGTDEVVESHQIRCTHYDAFRFFTPAAVPRNQVRPTRASQVDLEQPGCLHAGMDVYKWCYKLDPLVPSELTLAAFELALQIRRLDMAASPYDLTALGIEPVPIETTAGKAAYVTAQRDFAAHSTALRQRLIAVCESASSATTGS